PITVISPPSLHDALPICFRKKPSCCQPACSCPLFSAGRVSGIASATANETAELAGAPGLLAATQLVPRFARDPPAAVLRATTSRDRKSTRLNSSHVKISY